MEGVFVRYSSFIKVWSSLTKEQKRKLCPGYFKILDTKVKITGKSKKKKRKSKILS